ncbi:sugar phosphate isomerase/epimerase [Dyadobacter sp. CY323]|uniref:sugar phosphate isomerase/epimerase family protein n=1 Tax=Dyadobacter sp. CY323 TaxID=2907302 RepID=UPI001F4042C7|nr:TIM barrel protein [Dyadobacter sp. CY323]MCE6988979.1 sugar phosphate isomerase/epimerase [Dyadobacter sp. CY323]
MLLIFVCLAATHSSQAQNKKSSRSIYAKDNLIAWCIVPFDSKNRGPVERAEMLNKLGINKLAYDWREKHIPTFDAELDALKSHKIKLQAFWLYSGPEPETDKNFKIILDVLKRHQVKTQIWCMIGGIKDLDQMSQQEKINAHARAVAYIADKAAEIGCSVGLYNHGGWFGEPENQLEIIKYLNKPNIGIVYNLHHAEEHLETFPRFFPKMLPHLMAFNVAGLIKGNPGKVVPVGQGNAELELMRIVQNSSYNGPVGIINEEFAPDAEDGLRINMDGMQVILKELGDKKALKTYQ